MVDALRRAHEWVTAAGCVIDVHPTEVPAWLEIGGEAIGPLDSADASERHARATAALDAAIHEGLFVVMAAEEFTFRTYGDTVDELRGYIADRWRSTRIGPALAETARVRFGAHPAVGRPCVVEWVRLTVLSRCQS